MRNIILNNTAGRLQYTLEQYGIKCSIKACKPGSTVTAYTLSLPIGVKLSSLQAVLQDVARNLGVEHIRLLKEKGVLYLEIPNARQSTILFNDCLKSKAFMHSGRYDVLLGEDIFGATSVANLLKMPHLLVAGATGSGKSVGLHMMICSLLAKNTPATLNLILIDPKKTELSMYNTLPHLISDVITESADAAIALEWAVDEMERRYTVMDQENVRSISTLKDMPIILIVIDEMADLILSSDADIETSLIRLAQKARACGIHIITATQRPSREVVTGLIKANFPARLAYKTATLIDSRVILDSRGAELLLGQGDSLYMNVGAIKRIQAAYIDDDYLNVFVRAQTAMNAPIERISFKYNNVATKQEETSTVSSRMEHRDQKRITMAFWGVFAYSVYKMFQSILKFVFSPIKTTR